MSGASRLLEEIESEPKILNGFSDELRKSEFFGSLRKVGTAPIVLGCGDSLVAAKLAETLVPEKLLAIDPYELLLTGKVNSRRNYVVVSVSGRTRMNLKAADVIKKSRARLIAVTANPESKLGQVSREVLRLPYDATSRLPGTLGYTLSVVALLSLFGVRVRLEESAARWERLAKQMSLVAKRTEKAGFVFVGAGPAYATALYAQAKIFEAIGTKALAQETEEFCHTHLFCLEKSGETSVIFLKSPSDSKIRKVYSLLSDHGYDAQIVESHLKRNEEAALELTLQVQYFVYHVMRLLGRDSFAFLEDQERLRISDRLIY